MPDEERPKAPMDGVWVVNRWVEIAGTRVSEPGAYCEDQAAAKRLAQDINAQLGSMVANPNAKRFLQMFGIAGMGTNIRFVPRHSPVAVGPMGGGIVVGRS